MIVDCTQFFTEYDLLEIRLEELWNVVDKFVVMEATKTFSGAIKPLHLHNNISKFDKYKDKLIVAKTDLSDNIHPLERVLEQQNAIKHVLRVNGITPDSMVMLSDMDEIPTVQAVKEALHITKMGTYAAFRQKMYYYAFNLYRGNNWLGTTAARFKDLPSRLSELRLIAKGSKGRERKSCIIPDAGWHFTFLGSPERVQEKIKSWGHQELNRPRFSDLENIKSRMKKMVDPFDRHNLVPLEVVKIDETFPKRIYRHPEAYADLIIDKDQQVK